MFSTSDMFTLDFLLMTLPLSSSTVLSSSLFEDDELRVGAGGGAKTTFISENQSRLHDHDSRRTGYARPNLYDTVVTDVTRKPTLQNERLDENHTTAPSGENSKRPRR